MSRPRAGMPTAGSGRRTVLDATQAGSALLLGLSGAGHCLGMCGGIAGALQLGGRGGAGSTLAYHAGRIASYTALGALLGLAAGAVDGIASGGSLRYLAGMMLIGMGLYVGGWWRGMLALERAGHSLWHPVQRFVVPLLPAAGWRRALFLGLCWGLLPCGLIYSSLVLAAATGSAANAAAMMLVIGVGPLPAMLTVSLGAGGLQRLLKRRGLQAGIGLALIVGGAWTLYGAAAHGDHSAHAPGRDGSGGQSVLHTH